MEEHGGSSRRRGPVVLTGLAVALMLLLSVAVSGGGGAQLGEPRLPISLPGAAAGLGDLGSVQGEPEPQAAEDAAASDEPWALIVLGLLATAVVAAALRTLRPRHAEERRHEWRAEVAPEPGEAEAAQLTALKRAASTARLGVRAAEPRDVRNAVIAAWVALEDAAAAGGRPRQAAETPTEFTVALLARHAADATATATLLHLYHRARFGSAPLPPDAATAAAAALDAISASVDRART